MDLGLAWAPILCRVTVEIPTSELVEGLERALAAVERAWVADTMPRAKEVDGLLAGLVLPPEVRSSLRDLLAHGMQPNLDQSAATRIGDLLAENGVEYRVIEDGNPGVRADVYWPAPPRFNKRAWLASPAAVWETMEAYGTVVLVNDEGVEVAMISKPAGVISDE